LKAAFWKFMDESTKGLAGNSDPDRMQWLAAKCVGRWPSGAPVTLTPDADSEHFAGPERNNDFTYAADRAGYNCPLGAHIRRANPRDSLGTDPVESAKVSRKHQLVRRGRTYGRPLENPRSGVDDGADRGIIFMAINANISRQFEFIQQTWINDHKFNGLYDNTDAIAGHNDEQTRMVIQRMPFRIRTRNLPQFLRLKGGGYFFLPAMKALRFLAAP
jgi:deferrochelatase/peroxidase EfeB